MNAPRPYILVVDDDPLITDGLALLLERDGRTVIVCSDVESAEVALDRYPVTHVVTDVQFSDGFGFEGLRSLSRVRALCPGGRIVLITGYATPELRAAATAGGAAALLEKPFDVEELEAALALPRCAGGGEAEVVRIPAIEDVLRGGLFDTAYQPIVRLAEPGRGVFGFEALARTRGGWSVAGPAELFDYAERRDRLAELNVAAVTRAIQESAALPPHCAIFVNVDPATFASRRLTASLRRAADDASIALDRVVLEITERSGFTDCDGAARLFDELREAGVRFALDDHGCSYSHLSLIDRIRPSFVKISNLFGTAFEQDETKRRIVRNLAALARDFGAQTVLEGIESAATADAAAAAGIEFGQGFGFARPLPAAHWKAGPYADAAQASAIAGAA